MKLNKETKNQNKLFWKKGILIIMLTVFTFNLQSQHFGVKAGLNFSSLYNSKGENFSGDTKTGFAIGAFFSVPIGPFLGIQPEVMYSQKGYKGSGNVLIANFSYTRKVDYLDIPILLQLKPVPFLTVLAGPQFSFLLNKGFDFKSGSISTTQQTNIENNNIRKNTLGAVVGADINISHVVLSGRLAWDLQENKGDGTSISPKYKLMVAQITVGLFF